MTNEAEIHVRPIVLWQFICGGVELPLSDYEHIANCIACETFGEQIFEALRRVETTLQSSHSIN